MDGIAGDPLAARIDVCPEAAEEAPTTAIGRDQTSEMLTELLATTKELVSLVREQVEAAKRAEERAQKQHQAGRDELARWLGEHPGLGGRAHAAQEALRQVLGNKVADLVDFVSEHEEELPESDFLRTELADRFGLPLHHLSTLYGVVKRVAAVERTQKQQTRS